MGLNLAIDPTQALLEQLPVTTVLERNPLCLNADLPLSQAAAALLDKSVHSALVVNAEGQLIGIFTLQDLNRAATAHAKEANAPEPSLSKVCTRNLLWVYSNETLADATKRMQALGLHQLPVLDKAQPHPILGLLTTENISLATKLAQSRRLLADQSVQ
jgi:CBS domain-containing protein